MKIWEMRLVAVLWKTVPLRNKNTQNPFKFSKKQHWINKSANFLVILLIQQCSLNPDNTLWMNYFDFMSAYVYRKKTKFLLFVLLIFFLMSLCVCVYIYIYIYIWCWCYFFPPPFTSASQASEKTPIWKVYQSKQINNNLTQ